VVVSGLALNFIPDPRSALVEWKRVTRPGGSISAYVWDRADGMEFLRYAVIASDLEARYLDEGVRFPICRPEPLVDLFESAGLEAVGAGSIDVTTGFSDFADYWSPFQSGQGPAPAYVASLTEPRKVA
jgi:SAM-dependent methyltransferase